MRGASCQTLQENSTLMLTVKDVAHLLALSERTVWKLTSAGHLPKPIRMGRSVRWHRPTIEQFFERQQRG
jgi:excisionase family DNA binding protein